MDKNDTQGSKMMHKGHGGISETSRMLRVDFALTVQFGRATLRRKGAYHCVSRVERGGMTTGRYDGARDDCG